MHGAYREDRLLITREVERESSIRAVIYARISEDHERAESVPTQILNSTKHAKRMGWDVVHVFKDEGRSGYTGAELPRPGAG
jgi:DNA invertase Pin-like site-specific DNA recombinase